jgi:hypothetical protein
MIELGMPANCHEKGVSFGNLIFVERELTRVATIT